jgi:ketosteroid isomerase-like protein
MASAISPASPSGASNTGSEREFEEFVTLCHEGLGYQVGGKTEPFQALWSHADDVVIMGAVGTYTRGWEDVSAHLAAASKLLNWTNLGAENIGRVVRDIVALTIEQETMARAVDGKEESRTLRSTQAYRIENGDWKIIHRHANTVSPEG